MKKLLLVLFSLVALAACETSNLETTGYPGIGRRGPDYDAGAGGAGGTGMALDGAAIGNPQFDANSLAAAQDYLVNNIGDRVFFAFDSAVLDGQAQDVLQRQAKWLNENPQLTVTVEGHCDERGTREYNIALGDRRANAAKNYLVSLGVDSSRITTISYGKERPAIAESTEDAWAKNRRAVTVVNQ